MNKQFLKVIGVALTTLLLLVSSPIVTFADSNSDSIPAQNFVRRLYGVYLDREADSDGLNNWTSSLVNRKYTGIAVAYGFVFSPEYQGRNKSNEEYICDLYEGFLGRNPDWEGLEFWLARLNSDMTREEVFAGFANSVEFRNLCASYGIVCGDYFIGNSPFITSGTSLFVERLYNLVLSRNSDPDGRRNWTSWLINKRFTATEVVQGFFFSNEYLSKNKSDSEYVRDLYRTILGREPDSSGNSTWTGLLSQGFSRKYVLNGFLLSAEFRNLCNEYQISVGSGILLGPEDYGSSNTIATTSSDAACENVEDTLNSKYEKYVIDTVNGPVTLYAEFIDMYDLSSRVNTYRNSLGLQPYKIIRMNSYAKLRAVEVAYYFSHLSPSGTIHNDCPNISNGENCSNGINISSVYDAYLNSTSHRLAWEAGREAYGNLPANFRRYIAVSSVGVRLYVLNEGGNDYIPLGSSGCLNYNGSKGYGIGSVQEFWEYDNTWDSDSWQRTEELTGMSFADRYEISINPYI